MTLNFQHSRFPIHQMGLQESTTRPSSCNVEVLTQGPFLYQEINIITYIPAQCFLLHLSSSIKLCKYVFCPNLCVIAYVKFFQMFLFILRQKQCQCWCISLFLSASQFTTNHRLLLSRKHLQSSKPVFILTISASEEGNNTFLSCQSHPHLDCQSL